MAPRTTRGGWGRRQALCAVCCLPPAVASGSESRELAPGLWLDHWPESDGLPSDALYSLAIDDRGRLVMGSGDGVGFFDGVRFSVQRRGDPVAPPDDRVFWVGTSAADGALWLVTESGSAQRRLGGAVTDFGPLVDHAPTIRTSFDGPVPLVYTGKGVFELRDRPVKREDLPDAVSFPVSDEAGTWVRTLHDDLLLRPRGASAFRPATPEDGAPPPWDPPPNELASAADDVVSWRGQRVYEATKPILALRVADGEAWIATQGDGLLRLRESPMRLERGPDPEDVWVGSIVADPVAGTIWAARPWDRGWWSVDRPGHPAAFAGFVAENPADGQPRLLPVGVPGHGRWWFLTGNLHRQTSPEGAPQLRLGPPEQRACEPNPAAIHRSSDGRIYASGLLWDGDRWRPTPDGCGEPWTGVRAMADLPGEGVLVAAEARLTLLPFDGSAPRALSQPPHTRPRHVRVAEGVVWLATEQDGLCGASAAALLAGDARWRCLGRPEGLESQVHASAGDRLGRVWISTNRGLRVATEEALTAFARGASDEVPLLRLGERDGLLDEEFNGYAGFSVVEPGDGTIWFASQGGAVHVDPSALLLPNHLGGAIVAVDVGGDLQDPTAEIRLPSAHGAVTVDVALRPIRWAPHASARYRLADGPWTQATGPLHLGSLPAGPSALQVQARLLGPWEDVASIVLVREPLLTERGFFPALIAAGAIAALTAALALRNRGLERRRELLQGEVDRRTEDLRSHARALEASRAELLEHNATIASQARALEESDRLKSQFIADIAHELRTPLTMLVGSLEDIDDAEPARRSAAALHDLVEQLSDLQRLEGGARPLRARRLTLASVIEACAAQFTGAFAAAGRDLEIRLPDAPVVVWANATALTRALTNLLQNALRHGRGDVEVTLQATEPWARVSVRDHGPGVPPEDRARVFSRFVQLSTGDAKAAEGMGIGLALVKEIAEQHGGDVGVDAAPGGGALFWLTLPTGSDHLAIEDVAIDDVSPASPQRRTPPARRPEAPTGGPKLLLVEDNDELRGYLVSRLSSRYDVIEATNGDEGLAAARGRRPDVILSDVRMPGKDGLQMVRELRADPALARVPVMFLSAKTQEADRVAGLQLADDYLTKPFGTQELLARLARLTPGAAPVTPPPVESAFVERLTATADRSLGDADFHVAELAKAMAMSVRALQVRMKSIGLASPAEWLLERRLSHARELMRSGAHETVGEVADAVGLSRTYLARAYRAWAGKTPREEMRAGAT